MFFVLCLDFGVCFGLAEGLLAWGEMHFPVLRFFLTFFTGMCQIMNFESKYIYVGLGSFAFRLCILNLRRF